MSNPTSKIFRAANMRQARERIKAEVGADALILAQRSVPFGVEIEVALEQNLQEAPMVVIPEPDTTEEAARGVQPARTKQDSLARLGEMRAPLGAKWSDLTGALRFVGASGVGKTSTLIKTLVEWVMHRGPAGVVVIGTDQHKLAANEPLNLACQLLRVCLKEARPQEVPALVRKHGDAELLLIDTSATDTQAPEPIEGVQDVVVLSAQHAVFSLEDQLNKQQRLDRPWLALTHLDQAHEVLPLLSWLAERDVSLSFMSSSAYVPGGIEIATKESLNRHFG